MLARVYSSYKYTLPTTYVSCQNLYSAPRNSKTVDILINRLGKGRSLSQKYLIWKCSKRRSKSEKRLRAKLYTPSTPNTDLILAYTMDCDCSKILNHCFKSRVFSFTFQVCWVKIHTKFNSKFKIQI